MANKEHTEVLKRPASAWNRSWRGNPAVLPEDPIGAKQDDNELARLNARIAALEEELAVFRRAGCGSDFPRDRYCQLVDSLNVVIWCRDVEERFTYVSQAARSLLGYEPEALIGRTIDAVLTQTAAAEARASIDANNHSIPRPSSARQELVCRRNDGTEFWGEVHAHPIYDDQDRIVEIQGAMRDISDRKRAEEALRESQEKYRELVENANSIILRMDKRGIVTFFNEYASHFLGFSRDEIIGRNVVGTIVPVTESTGKDLVEMIRDIGVHPERYASNENENMCKDGTRVWVLWTNKPVFDDQGRCIEVLCIGNDITERKRAEQELRFKNIILSTQQEASIDGILVVDEEARVLSYNRRFVEMWGLPAKLVEDRVDKPVLQFAAAQMADSRSFLLRVQYLYKHRQETSQDELILADGRIFERYTAPMFGPDERYYGRVWYFRDITTRKQAQAEKEKLEAQLRQSQKMEAVGQLAGGVAHDFNNLLQIILGYMDILRADMNKDAAHGKALNAVRQAAERAADLTQQLLAFSRRQVIQPVNLNLNDLIDGVLKMIGRLIGEHIDLRFMPGERLGTVHVDKGQMEQILINLCVNARDAMPNGGTLAIETENVVIGDEYGRNHPWVPEGPYVLLSVTDTGHGMDEATRARIFEPFFTTKDVGQGTGLGLATVYGIVKQHNGLIHVYSEPDKGTEFKVYIPTVQRATEAVETKLEEAAVGGTETILVAEDEEMVRDLVSHLLKAAGYSVLSACDGEDALRVFEKHADVIDLALLDVMMPKLSGRDVMDRIQAKCRRIRFLFSSGYSENGVHTDFVLKEGLRLITKPYRRADLLRAVRERLDTPPAVPGQAVSNADADTKRRLDDRNISICRDNVAHDVSPTRS